MHIFVPVDEWTKLLDNRPLRADVGMIPRGAT